MRIFKVIVFLLLFSPHFIFAQQDNIKLQEMYDADQSSPPNQTKQYVLDSLSSTSPYTFNIFYLDFEAFNAIAFIKCSKVNSNYKSQLLSRVCAVEKLANKVAKDV